MHTYDSHKGIFVTDLKSPTPKSAHSMDTKQTVTGSGVQAATVGVSKQEG